MQEPLPIRWSRPLPKGARPTTITVSRDPAGRYFVSFLVEEDLAPLPSSSNTVGIDLGLEDVVTLSTGKKTGNEHFFGQEEKRLAQAQRRHAKKQKGGKNREKARRHVARIHARIADRRRDFQHQLTTRLIRENQVVCVESLAIENLLKNHCLAKAIADVGWGELLRMLSYKARWYGRSLVAINRWYPSSKRCSVCGHELESLSLAVRQWTCPKCGVVHDRDINAATNVKAEGLSVFACGEQVETKPAWKGGKARLEEAGKPSRERWNPIPLGDREEVNSAFSAMHRSRSLGDASRHASWCGSCRIKGERCDFCCITVTRSFPPALVRCLPRRASK